jgi:membrane protein YqaA with SNARE-associated domain
MNVDCEKIPKNKKLKKKVCKAINKNKEWLHGLGIGFWAFIILMFIIFFMFTFDIRATIEFLISDYGLIAIFFIAFFFDFLVQPIGPDVPLVIGVLSGVFNKWIVLFVVLLGSYLALYCAYLIGRKIGFSGIEKIIGKKKYQKIKDSPHYGKWILFMGAITPIPYIPYLAGMWEFKFKEVLLYVAIPRTIRFLIVMTFTATVSNLFIKWLIL